MAIGLNTPSFPEPVLMPANDGSDPGTAAGQKLLSSMALLPSGGDREPVAVGKPYANLFGCAELGFPAAAAADPQLTCALLSGDLDVVAESDILEVHSSWVRGADWVLLEFPVLVIGEDLQRWRALRVRGRIRAIPQYSASVAFWARRSGAQNAKFELGKFDVTHEFRPFSFAPELGGEALRASDTIVLSITLPKGTWFTVQVSSISIDSTVA
jgi:hypothetical protein